RAVRDAGVGRDDALGHPHHRRLRPDRLHADRRGVAGAPTRRSPRGLRARLRVRRGLQGRSGLSLAGSLLFGVSIRPPAVSGRFYPSDPAELRATVATLLADARATVRPSDRPTDRPTVGIIVPHAGYIYSGRTAA